MEWFISAPIVFCVAGCLTGLICSYIAARPLFDKNPAQKYFSFRAFMPRISAPKSIPVYTPIATILELTDDGSTSAVTEASSTKAVFDLQNEEDASYHEGLVRIEVWTRNGQGATPTSPGASTTYTLHYAFTSTPINDADDLPDVTHESTNAHTILANIDSTLTITLPDDSASDDEGTRFHATDPFVCPGRYLYVWYERTAFAANALVDLKAKLIRC